MTSANIAIIGNTLCVLLALAVAVPPVEGADADWSIDFSGKYRVRVENFEKPFVGAAEIVCRKLAFRLPDGDPTAGREAFLYMRCNQCHTIAKEELPIDLLVDGPYVELGGQVSRVRTYC